MKKKILKNGLLNMSFKSVSVSKAIQVPTKDKASKMMIYWKEAFETLTAS